MKFRSPRHGFREIHLDHINVFLGANGAGKSTILKEILHYAKQMSGIKAIYVEGGRSIKLENSIQLKRNTIDYYKTYSKALATYESKRQTNLSDRVYDALMVLESKETEIKNRHSDETQQWLIAGQKGACPIREQPPLEKLFSLFNEVFPRLEIEYIPSSKSLMVRKGLIKYEISSMSDGEKQAFSILADFIELGSEYGIVIVDEPELNLHPELAERIWNLIESQFSDKIYCYATHSLSFAMRKQVKKIIVLSDDPENLIEINDIFEIGKIDLFSFLGSIPGIIASERVVVTEGDEKSFDAIFYRWILQNNQIEVMAAGDCEQVKQVCNRKGIWSRIAPKVKLLGIIDRDLRLPSTGNEIILAFREAESFLAIPSLVVAIDMHLQLAESRISEDKVIEIILRKINDERFLICANYVSVHCGIRLGVSAQKTITKTCQDLETLKIHLLDSSSKEFEKAREAIGPDQVSKKIDEINTKINCIILEKKWAEALELIDGKSIGNMIAHILGTKNAADLMRAISVNIPIDKVSEVAYLACNIKENFEI